MNEAVPLPRISITTLLAPNPGPMTLDGTNTYVLSAPGGVWVIDPGPGDDSHLSRVAAAAASSRVRGIVLTHFHADHRDGAAALAEMLGDPPVYAADQELSPETRLMPAQLDLDSGARARVVPTPGHTSDSVCVLLPSGELLTGDTVLGRGSTIIAHPEGALGPYLESLSTLTDLCDAGKVVSILPGHGPAISGSVAVAEVLRGYRKHRLERLAQVRDAIDRGAQSVEDVVDVVYPNLESRLRNAALRSARAQIDYLRAR